MINAFAVGKSIIEKFISGRDLIFVNLSVGFLHGSQLSKMLIMYRALTEECVYFRNIIYSSSVAYCLQNAVIFVYEQRNVRKQAA